MRTKIDVLAVITCILSLAYLLCDGAAYQRFGILKLAGHLIPYAKRSSATFFVCVWAIAHIGYYTFTRQRGTIELRRQRGNKIQLRTNL